MNIEQMAIVASFIISLGSIALNLATINGIRGPKGDKGETGPMGPQGPMGMPGRDWNDEL